MYDGSLISGISDASMPMFCSAVHWGSKQTGVGSKTNTQRRDPAHRFSPEQVSSATPHRADARPCAVVEARAVVRLRTTLALGGGDAAAPVDVELPEHGLQREQPHTACQSRACKDARSSTSWHTRSATSRGSTAPADGITDRTMISFSLKIGGNCARATASLRCTAKHVIRAGVQPYTSKRGCVRLQGAPTDDGTSSGSNCPSSSWQRNTARGG